MAEYIEREALLKDIAKIGGFPWSEWETAGVFNVVTKQPAADVAPVVHGRWVKPSVFGYRAFDIPHCSVCETVPCGVDENTKYCANCGARMDGE